VVVYGTAISACEQDGYWMEALHLMNSTSAEIGCSGYNNKSTGVQNWQWTAHMELS